MTMVVLLFIYWKYMIVVYVGVCLWDVLELVMTLKKEKEEDARRKETQTYLAEHSKKEIEKIDNILTTSESYTYLEITILLQKRNENIQELKELKTETPEYIEKIETNVPVDLKKLMTRNVFV